MKRMSVVQHIAVNEVTLASTLLIGDVVDVKPLTLALAVHRQVSDYVGTEGSFRKYPVFTSPIPQPVVYENVSMTVRNSNPFIRVRSVDVISVSSSSLLQVGSNCRMDLESRGKDIRQFVQVPAEAAK